MEENQENFEKIIEKRKEKLGRLIKNKFNLVIYFLLAIIVFIGWKIRTSNVSKLKDVATGGWTLGPDLDPFLFLRWSEYIVEHGTLFSLDMMRYIPLGYSTARELRLLPYMMAWFHNFLSALPSKLISILPGKPEEITVTYSAILFPAVMFAFTVVAFFLLTRKIFIDSLGEKKANIISLIASVFLTILPPLLPRTIAGIPEKESVAFLFLFLAFYFFLSAWKATNIKNKSIFAILAGISTGAMALTWGGFNYIFLILSIALSIAFLLKQIKKDEIIIIVLWLISSFLLMTSFTQRYSLSRIITSITAGVIFLIFIAYILNELILRTNLKKIYYSTFLKKIPRELFSLLVAGILGVIGGSIIEGKSFVFDLFKGIRDNLVAPATSRLIQTVAENRQPFFAEWSGSFGPLLGGNVLLPIFLWLFLFGSVYLFYKTVNIFKKKERIILALSYLFFLISVVFSRYSSSGRFNGTNFESLLFYALGFLILFSTVIYYYFKYYFSDERKNLSNLRFEYILILAFFFFGIVSARGAVRLIMVLVPPASIIVSYFVVEIFSDAKKAKDEMLKMILWMLTIGVITLLIFSGLQFYQSTSSQAEIYAPSIYTNQWQNAMAWVNDNTSENAVFGHWWDYGYWVQSIGKRATILDGGNAISYWNHLMGREVLTNPEDKSALEFLYAHNATHYLIDSSEIGKYTAYSTIGSDVNYDRQGFIPTIFRDERLTKETNNGSVYVYPTGIPLDEDLIFTINGTEYKLAQENSGIGGIIINEVNGKLEQPIARFVSANREIDIPLNYLYYNGNLYEFESGIEAGIFLTDQIVQSGNSVTKKENYAGFYLSERTINSFMVRKYLFEEEGNFKLVHNELNVVIQSLRDQGMNVGDFAYFQGNFLGPIKIWEINYPSSIEFKEEYLETHYPEEIKFA
jgi:asparagine N-glycosylation enzyme membrane subunit Stt3